MTEPTTRAEHIAWAKERALEYLEMGQLMNAFNSMISDLGKHTATRGDMTIKLGVDLFARGKLDTTREMREWIEGF